MSCLKILTMKYTSGHWNVYLIKNLLNLVWHLNHHNLLFLGIGRVALDTRLGCLSSNLPPDSEPQQIIDAAKFALRNVATLELKAPYWRYFPTPMWTRYVKNMNYFVE